MQWGTVDRQIARRPAWRRWGVVAIGGIAGIGLLVALVAGASRSRLAVDSARISSSVVRQAEFLEYASFDATVEPAESVFLDLEEGGRVEKIYVEGGEPVKQGDPILRFSNATLQRTVIDSETQLLENLDALRTTQFNRAQNTLLLEDRRLELDQQLRELEKKYQRYENLSSRGGAVSVEQYESVRDELETLRERRRLLSERIRQEEKLSELQVANANRSIERLNRSLELLSSILGNLELRAPISGWLSTLDAEVGQSLSRGQRIGQVDVLDRFKLRLSVDQYYSARVRPGVAGQAILNSREWGVTVRKSYPEVRDGTFAADAEFVDETPPDMRRGQTVSVELRFGTAVQALLVSRGGFQQQAAAGWVYRLDVDGRRARRTPVRLGRQNPRDIEVLDGLRAGDRIVTSSYDAFGGVEELRFNPPLQGTP